MARLFVAVWPSGETLQALASLPRPQAPGVRWTTREQWHVTLRFLGRVSDVQQVADALASVRGDATEAVLGPSVEHFGWRVLQVPVRGLEALAGQVAGATAHLEEHRPGDGDRTERGFSGHVTLARIRPSHRAPPEVKAVVGAGVSGSWRAEEFCLVESHTLPTGARYEVLERYPVA